MTWATRAVIAAAYILHTTYSYTLEYRGFDTCGHGGWHCNSNGTDFEVIYECPTSNGDARLWTWTARIPSRATVLVVRNCRYVELHMDCTTGYRSYSIRQYRASNIDTLEILPPLRPHVFLHDNDEIAHAPPELVFENVNNLKWAPRSFERAGGRCRTKQQVLKRIAFYNVGLPSINEGAFSNIELDSFIMKNVGISSVTSRSLAFSVSQFEMTNSSFPKFATDALQVQADKMILIGNKFGDILTNAIKARAHSFLFSQNQVGMVKGDGFNVMARHVNFTKNNWTKLETSALRSVAPGEKISDNFIVAEKFTFVFSDNRIDEIMENSLHPSYHAYKGICSSVIVERNTLPCTCELPFEDPSKDKTKEWWQHFYGEMVLTQSNTCKEAVNCSLQQTLLVLQRQACSEDVHAQAVCANITASYYTPTEEPTTPATSPPTVMANTPHTIPDYSTTMEEMVVSEHTAEFNSDSTRLTVIIVIVAASLLAFAGAAGGVYILQKNRAEAMSATYRHQRDLVADEDQENLIIERLESDRPPSH